MLDTLQASTFEALRGQRFRLRLPDQDAADAILVEAQRIAEAPGASGRVPFSLLFACSGFGAPVQGLFQLEHESIGDLELFMVPVGQDQRGLLLEAVFT